MDARNRQGQFAHGESSSGLLLKACLCLALTLSSFAYFAQPARAELFTPTSTESLVAAFATAGSNAQDDIIDLGGQVFDLTGELVLEPDEGHALELRNGALQRVDGQPPFRLLHLISVPFFIEDEGLPVFINGVQFKNGLFEGNDPSGGVGGGGALLTNRKQPSGWQQRRWCHKK